MNDKPDMLKPVVWDKDSGTITPVDQMDWRIEGTAANQRVEYLLRKVNLWLAISLVMAGVLIFMFLATLSRPLGWMDAMVVAQASLMWACYFRAESFRRRIGFYTEGE